MMSDGRHGALKYSFEEPKKMNILEPVAMIEFYREKNFVYYERYGFKFLSKSGTVLLQVGYCHGNV